MAALPTPPKSLRRHFPAPSQVPQQIPNFLLHYTTQTRFISCSARLQFFSLSSKSQQIPCQKPIIQSKNPDDQLLVGGSLVNKTIKELTDDGSFSDAIRFYIILLEHGTPISKFQAFPLLIKAFGGLSDIKRGRQIHGHLLKLGVSDDVSVSNSLLSMYFKCGALTDAIQFFDKMTNRDSVSWNTVICGFHKSGCFIESLIIFRRMVRGFGICPSPVACVSALSTCASLRSLITGREIHCFVIQRGLEVNDFVISGLMEMYMKCGDLVNAEQVFQCQFGNELLRGNVVLWNVMILGYVSNGYYSQALELFIEMLKLGLTPDSSTMVAALVLCSELMNIVIGRQIHGLIFVLGLDDDVRVRTALIDMYFKCDDAEEGLSIFERCGSRNLVMWGAVISHCARSSCPTRALELFCIFTLEYGSPDSIILLAVLRACSSLTSKVEGMQIHCLTLKMGLNSDVFVGGALVDFYAKCGDMESSQKAFSVLSERDLISWNALISGYAQNDLADEALKAFQDMQSENIRPNAVTAACMLSVCTYLSVMNFCKELHGWIIRYGIELNVLIVNSLIAAYAKCGDITKSWSIFERMVNRNEISWNSVMHGLGMHGRTDDMFALFEKMKASNMKPDKITFMAILSACSHAGRVDEGWKHFRSMVEDYKLKPQLEHYTCMVDLLGRAGFLNEAYDLIRGMPYAPDDRIWGSLLGSCKGHGNEGLAKVVANEIFKLDPANIGYHVLLANLYEDFGKRNEVDHVRSKIKDMGLKKRPGCSWIEIDSKIHVFIASDNSHYFSEEIFIMLDNLTSEIMRLGYTPRIPFIQHV